MEQMKRVWPFAFLIAFVLILTFHRIPPPQPGMRIDVRPAVDSGPLPEFLDPSTTASPPGSKASIETPEAATATSEPRSAVLAGLLWALRQQNEDGSWGDVPTTIGERTIGKTGITSLVLLSLLGAGYSQLSKDEYDGVAVGPLVKKGLKWLISQQREDGTFLSGHDPQFDHALASLAINEAYGMTASFLLKEPATLSLDALARLQGADGSWGGSTPTPWAVQALVSGELNELPVAKETREQALAYLRTHAHPGQLATRQLLKDRSDPDAMESLAQSIAGSPPRAGETDFEALYHQAMGLYLYDGADGVLWKKWSPAAREALLSPGNPDGSWNGGSLSHRLVRASLAEFSLQIYYRYSNSFSFGR